MSISILILTLNEETNLLRCLNAFAWSDDIVIFDSFSTDHTVEIGRSAGARVIQHKFSDYGSQREAARKLDYKYPWVFAVDADELPDAKLIAEIKAIAGKKDNPYVAYRLRRKDHFMGKWIKHCTLYPSWFIRLYRPEKIFYEPRPVHEYPTVQGEIGELKGHLLHYNFSKGLTEWLTKHMQYAEFEARVGIKEIANRTFDWKSILFTKDPVKRRRALKALSHHLPFRPTLRFCYNYFLRLGFLDGWEGLTYCRLMKMYEYMIVLKMKEIERREKGLPI